MRARRGFATTTGPAVALVVGLLTSCGGASGHAGATATASAAQQAVVVMAPAPLKAALEKARGAFEAGHPGNTVTLNFGHVPALLTQISEGVPADVVITPDQATMQQVVAKKLAGTTVPVAANRLVLVVPAANPGAVDGVTSLGRSELIVAVCAADLPCGRLTTQLAAKAGVRLTADSQEPGGSPAVVTKAAAGEIDLGVAFATDVQAAGGRARAIPLDDALGASATVTAAALTSPAHRAAADQFIAFLSSAEGKAAFTAAGFAPL